jgi:hypothetical protein
MLGFIVVDVGKRLIPFSCVFVWIVALKRDGLIIKVGV